MIAVAASEERFIEAIADRERVCCCICPAARPQHRDVCVRFIKAGGVLVLERVGQHYAARCLPCARVLGYKPRATAPGIDVLCPACGAEPGQPCRSVGGTSGRTLSQPHAVRARAGAMAR